MSWGEKVTLTLSGTINWRRSNGDKRSMIPSIYEEKTKDDVTYETPVFSLVNFVFCLIPRISDRSTHFSDWCTHFNDWSCHFFPIGQIIFPIGCFSFFDWPTQLSDYESTL